MPHDLSLLLQPVLLQPPARLQAIIIPAEGVAFQRQENALLILPDMRHFMDEQALPVERAFTEIAAEQIVLRMEPEMPIGRHGDPFRLKRKPFAVVHAHPCIVDRMAEDAGAHGLLPRCQGAAGWMGTEQDVSRSVPVRRTAWPWSVRSWGPACRSALPYSRCPFSYSPYRHHRQRRPSAGSAR